MARYSAEFKQSIIKKMMPKQRASLFLVAHKTANVGAPKTNSRWSSKLPL